jgi:hypothetical protein
MDDNEYRELEKKVILKRYEELKSGKVEALPL